MEINFIKDSNQLYFENYYVFLNNQKYKVPVNLNLEVQEKQLEFYIKTAWMKSRLYKIKEDQDYIIKIGNIITKRIYFTLVAVLLILVFFTLYFDTDFMWNLTTFLCILWGCFQLYLYTFGQNRFIKVKIEKK